MIYCMIPSRRGSERIPGKVNQLLGGKPLICWTIDQALESKYIDDITNFTNDDETKKIVHDTYYDRFEYKSIFNKINTFHKPDELSKGTSTVTDAALEFIKIRDLKEDDILVTLYATVPFRSFIDNTIEYFIDNNCKSLQALKRCQDKPFGSLKRRYIESNKRDIYELVVPEWENIYRTQDCPELFFASGGIYIAKIFEIPKLNTQYFNIETYGYVIENDLEILDIDTIYDLNFAEASYKRWLNERRI